MTSDPESVRVGTLSKKSALESWVSGLNHRFAKPASGVTRSESSNLSLSATIAILMGHHGLLEFTH